MCVVTVWHPSIGNIIPILGYITLDTPVTVVTSGELQTETKQLSETKTWQPYGALVSWWCSHLLITPTYSSQPLLHHVLSTIHQPFGQYIHQPIL